ncbi:MAG: aconitase/3-isopropylmalate dehydratase large subunit family protein [Bacteroidales bacterium]|nr:aconitase/3-isopropylmalate dehydratase large subunit family protein [Bacteroidales bacterium]
MGMTVIEKILAAHSGRDQVHPGEIVDVRIDARAARDFGGANVVRHLEEHHLTIDDPSSTFFTFDCNPTGSDQKYAANQHRCRQFARKEGIKVYDIDKGIGTHILMEEGLSYPGSTAVSTDSHANILGAVGAFGQGMGDKDIAVAWHKGSTWFKVPPSVKIVLESSMDSGLTAKDMVLNLLDKFGASTLLGCSVEMVGEAAEKLTLDQRITVASMATEMGAIIIFFNPSKEVIRYCESRTRKKVEPVLADADAQYEKIYQVDVSGFNSRISLPGKPHDTAELPAEKVWIDSAFIGSCTNGRIEDMRAAAEVLKGRVLAEGVVLKIVPATDRVWQACMEEGLLNVLKEAGALVSNAGCAGCAAGQVGQNGPGECTISTGNRNFPGKQGQGEVYLASPSVVAASALAGYITSVDALPEVPEKREFRSAAGHRAETKKKARAAGTPGRPNEIEGRAWYIPMDNIDTDMIFHNRHLSITDIEEMGQYTFGNLSGYEDFAKKVKPGDIVVTGKNFGSGSSRQQAVDCFISLDVRCVLAESFGAIYERNAINAAFPIMNSDRIASLELEDGDVISLNFETGAIRNVTKNIMLESTPFSEVQMEIYQNNGLF